MSGHPIRKRGLVLSETVLALVRERMMSGPVFDRERIVAILTPLIQRTESEAEGLIAYEYREAEYEYEDSPNLALDAEQRFTWF